MGLPEAAVGNAPSWCPANQNQPHIRQQTNPLSYKSMRMAEKRVPNMCAEGSPTHKTLFIRVVAYGYRKAWNEV